MKPLLFLFACATLFTLLLIPLPVEADSAAPAVSPSADDESAQASEDVLHDAMEAMEKALEKLAEASARFAEDEGADQREAARLEASLALDELAAAIRPSLGCTPPAPRAEEGAEGDAAPDPKAMREREVLFQLELVAMLSTTLETELALVRGDWEAVMTGVDALYDHEQAGHKKFRPKRKRRRW